MSDVSPTVDYTSRDYSSFRQSMIDLIPSKLPTWTSRSEADFGIVLIELFAYIGDVLSFYGDRIANEAYLDTAVNPGSVRAIAAMLDYRPASIIPAVVQLQFTVPSGSNPTLIPAGTQVSTVPSVGTAAIYFETDTDLYVPPQADLSATPQATPQVDGPFTRLVPATQGQTYFREPIGSSDGVVNQVFALFNHPVIEDSVHIYVDEGNGAAEWTLVDHLIDADPNHRAYTLFETDEGITEVLFGDGVNGKVPAPGAVITSTYRVGSGVAGNVGAGTLVVLTTPINNVTVTNPNAAVGGVDAESLDSIRRNAPKALTTAGRAVAVSDYVNLALRVAGVAKAAAEAEVYANVSLYIAQVGGTAPADFVKDRVLNYLADKKMFTTSVSILDPTFVGVNITAQVSPLDQYDPETVRANAIKALLDLLAFDNVDFGQRITLSSVYRALHGADGVDYAFVKTFARADNAVGTQTAAGDLTFAINEIPVTSATLGATPQSTGLITIRLPGESGYVS